MEHHLLDLHLAQTTPYPTEIEVDYAKGSYIYDKQGNAYLDFISGIAVSSLGHAHPRINQALKEQIDRHLHVMVYGEFIQDAQKNAAIKLAQTFPSSIDAYYFLNSGTEANEAAIKLSKRISGRSEIIAMKGAYHGSTNGSLSISFNDERKAAYQPLLPEIKFIAFNNISELNEITNQTAAIFIETIQGDAGVRIADKSYFKALREKCNSTGTMLICDEIQCGFGRSGKVWAFEHYDVVPDMITAGKALGGGLPIGLLATSKEMMKQFSFAPELGHITTFGGHPLACAAAAEAIQILLDEKLVDQVASKEQMILDQLNHPKIKAIRSLGLMMAVELESPQMVEFVVKTLLKKGLILFWFLSTPNAFRIAPPLNISDDDISKACELICQTLDELT